jgi:homoserine O-acetyltransferase
MPSRHWIIILFFVCAGALADSPQQMASIGDLLLESGETLHDCELGYRTAGTLNADKSNVIVFPTWFTGTSGDLLQYELIGPGKLADTDRYFVISIDALGNGLSSSPSTSAGQPGAEFPDISIDDMVSSQYILLTQHLGIDHALAVMGVSMGGMQTFQWIGQHPKFMAKAVPIEGSPRMTSYDLLQWQTHETAIEMMQEADISNSKIAEFLATANLLTLWTPEYFVENISPEAFPEYLAGAVKDYAQMDVNDYLSQLRAMMNHNVYVDDATDEPSYAQKVEADVLVIGSTSDHMVNPIPGKKLSESIGAEYDAIENNCGHMGSTCEAGEVAVIVKAFLKLEECSNNEASPCAGKPNIP